MIFFLILVTTNKILTSLK